MQKIDSIDVDPSKAQNTEPVLSAMAPTLIDLFSGCGGLGLAFTKPDFPQPMPMRFTSIRNNLRQEPP